jgi:hypothetical protein
MVRLCRANEATKRVARLDIADTFAAFEARQLEVGLDDVIRLTRFETVRINHAAQVPSLGCASRIAWSAGSSSAHAETVQSKPRN